MKATKKASDGSSDENCCPICLCSILETGSNFSRTNEIEFVYSRSCGHIYCLTCIQQLLLAPSIQTRTNQNSSYNVKYDAKASIPSAITPTHNICPMCRADISYFDLCSCYLENGSIVKMSNTIVSPEPLPDVLCRSVFSQDEDVEGPQFSITFPTNAELANSDGIIIIDISVIDGDEKFISTLHITPTKYHFLSLTHTLLVMGKGKSYPDECCKPDCHVWLTFSDNFQFITHGVARFSTRLQPSARTKKRAAQNDLKTVSQYVVGGDDDAPVLRNGTVPVLNTRSGPRKAPSYNKSSLWGNVFCQRFTVGVTSYHFLPLDPNDPGTTVGEAYASYEHVIVAAFPPLDDGQPVPSRVKFRNISCPDPYTFRASLCWMDDYNTTWLGASRWDYEMKFDTSYMCIVSGTANRILIHENGGTTEETSEEMFFYGEGLQYINAGLFHVFLRDYTNPGSDAARFDDWLSPDSVIDRLQEDCVPDAIIEAIDFLQEAASVAASGDNEDGRFVDGNPIDLRYFYEFV